MKKNSFSILLICFLLLIVCLANINCRNRNKARADTGSSLTCSSISHGDIERTYWLYIPKSYDKNIKTPLVIVLHGGGGTGKGMDKLTGFNDLAEKENFIVVYPDGIEKHWNDGRIIEERTACEKNIDDVGFISSLIDKLCKDLNIDSSRVYVTGISNGGMMSYRLALEIPEKIAAIACVVASMSDCLSAKPGKAISVLIMNGTKDPLMPWNGGYIGFGGKKLGKVISTYDTVNFWVNYNNCSLKPLITWEINRENDDTKVRKEVYTNENDEIEVILYAIEGGGHTWPGGWQYLSEKIIGKTCKDIKGTELIWEFFKRHKITY